ncbi:hypothetical protein BDAP_000216 [Binucleata daphniae]
MIELRTPKGTIDVPPKEKMITDKLLEQTIQIYKKHGAVSIDTPTFELRSILTNKYGDDAKLIFDLADQGGDICSLRYDLTVSFARYIAMNRVQKIKRYQIGKVFRRDQPAITKGKYREFLQCDFDIAGDYLSMTADAEILKIADECLKAYEIGEYTIKVNHRNLLSAIFEIAEINDDIHNTICSTVDKIDKLSINEIRKEFKAKGLNDKQIETVEKYIAINGNIETIENLKKTELYTCEKGFKAIEELILLDKYMKIYKVNIVYDLSLARGTDYYTGVIFEGVYVGHKIGAVIGGGRYDNLVNDFVLQNGGKEMVVPCIGFSVGVARIFSILKNKNEASKENEIQVFVGSSGSFLLEERMELMNDLWEGNISTETYYNEKMNFRKQAAYCVKNQIKIMVIIGDNELKEGVVQVADETNEKTTVKRTELVAYLKAKIKF